VLLRVRAEIVIPVHVGPNLVQLLSYVENKLIATIPPGTCMKT